MLQELISRKAYTAAIAAQIEAMGEIAISVANRWVMGWPQRVKRWCSPAASSCNQCQQSVNPTGAERQKAKNYEH